MPTPNKVKWTPALLAIPTARLMAVLEKRGTPVSASAISAARRRRGIPSPDGHGGAGRGQGRKPIKP